MELLKGTSHDKIYMYDDLRVFFVFFLVITFIALKLMYAVEVLPLQLLISCECGIVQTVVMVYLTSHLVS